MGAFTDRPEKKFKKAHELTCEILFGDNRYKKMTKEDKMFPIRACRKPNCNCNPRLIEFCKDIPIIINFETVSNIFTEFIKKLSDYYENSREYKILSEKIKPYEFSYKYTLS